MKLLHLADLHIGRRLNGLSLMEDQRAMVEQVLVMAQNCDAVLLCGDLFDKAQPNAESIRLVSDLLVALSRLRKPVLAVSGNHDSPEQVAYCRELLQTGGVYIAPPYEGELVRHTLTDEYGPVHFWLLPFIKPANVRPYFPEVSTYEDAVRAVLKGAPIDFSQRNVLLMHQFVSGASTCGSESPSLGGLDPIGAEALDGFDYVALGHLHSPQRLRGGRVCYAGSPLKYSLDEANQKKAALLVTLGPKGALKAESLPFHPLRDVGILRGTLQELCEKQSDDYLYAVLTDEGALLDPIGSLRLHYPNLLGMTVESSRAGESAVFADIETAESLTPLEHFIAFYRAQNNDQPPNERQLAILTEVVRQAEGEPHEADHP